MSAGNEPAMAIYLFRRKLKGRPGRRVFDMPASRKMGLTPFRATVNLRIIIALRGAKRLSVPILLSHVTFATHLPGRPNAECLFS
jgi:hypothetical protein